MKALISPNELITDINGNVGCRIVQIDEIGFEVASPLFWLGCSNDCNPNEYYYIEQQILPLPKEQEIIQDNTITE